MKIALCSPMGLFILGERDEVVKFFSLCKQILEEENIVNKELITDRLYRKYVRFSDIEETKKIIEHLKLRFNKLKLGYQNYFERFDKMFEEVAFLEEQDELFGRVQIGIGQIPYTVTDTSKSDEFYDALTDRDAPFWMREITVG